jgi:hypothetical protein
LISSWAISVIISAWPSAKAFSREVDTGSREENALNQK